MNIAVMQPYLFPYLGYFQLAASVEKFVFFDDVNFIKKGYIHRNQILVNTEQHRFSVPLKKVSQNDLIKDVYVSEIFPDWKIKFLKTIELSYSKSLNYREVLMLL
ncbi:MAG: WbqC family protein, partial [Salibacteraceae bacterium]|nr:WbqC family protein [Salibacteraceae bacterium]